MKNWLIAMVLLTGTWLLLSSSLGTEWVVTGIAVSLVVVAVFAIRQPIFRDVSLKPKALLFLAVYPFVFMKALIIANIDVARRVLSPALPINPAIVEVKTTLKTSVGRLVLANSITLTPGTLSVEILEDSLFIHWIDASDTDVIGATQTIVRGFERYLEVIYG